MPSWHADNDLDLANNQPVNLDISTYLNNIPLALPNATLEFGLKPNPSDRAAVIMMNRGGKEVRTAPALSHI